MIEKRSDHLSFAAFICKLLLFVFFIAHYSIAFSILKSDKPVMIGTRLELFVDHHLIDSIEGAELRLNRPTKVPAASGPAGAYMTVFLDGRLYKSYYRSYEPDYTGSRRDGNLGERTCYIESLDGINWIKPDLDLDLADDFTIKHAIGIKPPFTHNFSPFLDTRPGVTEKERYKALAGIRQSGLHAFASGDGIHWRKMSEEPVITHNPEIHESNAFDSQNVAFWSESEQIYVAYFRQWKTPHGRLRSIGRATSKDFVNWTDETEQFEKPNLPGEHLYTNQTHPYFRAPHIYIALPTRYMHGEIRGKTVEGNIGSTDILFMTKRAGANAYDRMFKEAFIRPGLDPEQWGNRSNYVALNVIPTGPNEMSIYHRNGYRYVLRTDGFVSVNAPFDGGELITKPLVFDGNELVLNLSTSITGSIRVELQDAGGQALPGFTLDESDTIIGDTIEHTVSWNDNNDVGEFAGKPVRIRFVMNDSDIYSFRFR